MFNCCSQDNSNSQPDCIVAPNKRQEDNKNKTKEGGANTSSGFKRTKTKKWKLPIPEIIIKSYIKKIDLIKITAKLDKLINLIVNLVNINIISLYIRYIFN